MTGSRRALIVVAVLFAVLFGLPWSGAVPEASAQTIQVESAYPGTAEQGTLSLPVTIKGNGFKKGAKAKFYLPNTSDPGGITVSSTRVVDSTQLIATIDVASTAVVSGFDIIVQNTDGRTGKGTELFTVLKREKPWDGSLSAVVDDTTGNKVLSDGQGVPYIAPAMQQDGTVAFDPTYGFGVIRFGVASEPPLRTIVFDFDPLNNVRPAVSGGMVECREWGSTTSWYEAPPDWLGGPLVASWFLIRTEALVTYVEVTPGVWDWISTGTYFNVRDMGVGTTAVVGLNMTFKDSTYREYWVSFNEEHWGGKDLKLVSGFARVTHPDADTWVLEPLGEGELRPIGLANQANLFAHWPAVKKVHGGGNCDLGDWLMPFRITLTALR